MLDESVSEWRSIDRSDWPEVESPDFAGLPRGFAVMVVVCPGCGLYRDNDDAPDDHEDDCTWKASRG